MAQRCARATSIAVGPTTGTELSSASSTIPTDPFTNATRLPGARDWGLDIMTPLASPSVSLPSGQTVTYKVGLAPAISFRSLCRKGSWVR